MLKQCYQAYLITKPFAVGVDLEKYCDIYEISRTDMDLAAEIAGADHTELDDADTLKALKYQLQNLHAVRKLFLCSLLALDADGGKWDFVRWAAATETMDRVSAESRKTALEIEEVLGEEDGESNAHCYIASTKCIIASFPGSPNPEGPIDPWQGEYEKSDEEAWVALSGYTWPPGQNAPPSRGVRESFRAIGRNIRIWE